MLSAFFNQLRVHVKHSGQRQSSTMSGEPREELGSAIMTTCSTAFPTDIPTKRKPPTAFGISTQPTDDFIQKDLITSSWN
ncbi:hypothetical protein BDA99DRAFT_504990 [Phascolomyces articulosus]|uniref:Uncharacterized protein n=1 Tax=Phascolomyces articulosus TaxID=60185 RepID=A0AAD5KIV6_9FUNG|nr:hypothetical protein BDA99DRAFT_504990 [Phascolomyces articulosus]